MKYCKCSVITTKFSGIIDKFFDIKYSTCKLPTISRKLHVIPGKLFVITGKL